MTDADPCPECGAALPESGDCWTQLHELLEIETRVLPVLDAEAGKRAHFFAVATYQLQHPSRLTREALDGLRAGVSEMAGPSPRPIAHLRREVGRFAAGPRRVTRSAAGGRSHVDPRWPRSWPMTALDVTRQADAAYPEAVARWAAATLEAIDAGLADSPGPRG